MLNKIQLPVFSNKAAYTILFIAANKGGDMILKYYFAMYLYRIPKISKN